MRAAAAHVVDLDGRVLPQLALEAEGPLVHERRLEVVLEEERPLAAVGRRGALDGGRRVEVGDAAVEPDGDASLRLRVADPAQQLVQAHDRVGAADGGVARGGQELIERRGRLALLDHVEGPGDEALVGDAIAAAHGRAAVAPGVPREPEHGREVVLVRLEPGPPGARTGGLEGHRTLAAVERLVRGDLHPRLVVGHGVELVAQAQVQREPRRHPPVVLQEGAVLLQALVQGERLQGHEAPAVAVEDLVHAPDAAQQHVVEGVEVVAVGGVDAGAGQVHARAVGAQHGQAVEAAEGGVRSREREAGIDPEGIPGAARLVDEVRARDRARLEGVPSAHPGDVVEELRLDRLPRRARPVHERAREDAARRADLVGAGVLGVDEVQLVAREAQRDLVEEVGAEVGLQAQRGRLLLGQAFARGPAQRLGRGVDDVVDEVVAEGDVGAREQAVTGAQVHVHARGQRVHGRVGGRVPAIARGVEAVPTEKSLGRGRNFNVSFWITRSSPMPRGSFAARS